MPTLDDLVPGFSGKYLKLDAIPAQGMIRTIARVGVELFPGSNGAESQSKAVVAFREKGPKWVLNKSSGRVLASLFGPDTDGWSGKRVLLVVGQVQGMNGALVDSIVPTDAPPRLDEDGSGVIEDDLTSPF